eukprot:s830_g13.t1
MAGFAKHIPYASSFAPAVQAAPSTFKFKENDFAIIHQEPRILIIRVSAAALKCLVLVGHAPHSGDDSLEIEAWWHHLFDCVPQQYATWPRVLVVDANASVGHVTDDSIGGFQAGPPDAKAEHFEAFVHRSDLWLPATFDHAACADILFDGEIYIFGSRSRRPSKINLNSGKSSDLATRPCLMRPGNLFCKRTSPHHLAELNERQRLDQLEFLFAARRTLVTLASEQISAYTRLLGMQDMLIAKALADFELLNDKMLQR